MTLRHYKIFVTVCDTMNMTAAAEMLFMSQSAVSQAIAELEAHYGEYGFLNGCPESCTSHRPGRNCRAMPAT